MFEKGVFVCRTGGGSCGLGGCGCYRREDNGGLFWDYGYRCGEGKIEEREV